MDDIAEFQKKQGILRNMFIDNLTVSGNLSFNNIDDNDFLTNVRDILKQHDAVYLGRKVASIQASLVAVVAVVATTMMVTYHIQILQTQISSKAFWLIYKAIQINTSKFYNVQKCLIYF